MASVFCFRTNCVNPNNLKWVNWSVSLGIEGVEPSRSKPTDFRSTATCAAIPYLIKCVEWDSTSIHESIIFCYRLACWIIFIGMEWDPATGKRRICRLAVVEGVYLVLHYQVRTEFREWMLGPNRGVRVRIRKELKFYFLTRFQSYTSTSYLMQLTTQKS